MTIAAQLPLDLLGISRVICSNVLIVREGSTELRVFTNINMETNSSNVTDVKCAAANLPRLKSQRFDPHLFWQMHLFVFLYSGV